MPLYICNDWDAEEEESLTVAATIQICSWGVWGGCCDGEMHRARLLGLGRGSSPSLGPPEL